MVDCFQRSVDQDFLKNDCCASDASFWCSNFKPKVHDPFFLLTNLTSLSNSTMYISPLLLEQGIQGMQASNSAQGCVAPMATWNPFIITYPVPKQKMSSEVFAPMSCGISRIPSNQPENHVFSAPNAFFIASRLSFLPSWIFSINQSMGLERKSSWTFTAP